MTAVFEKLSIYDFFGIWGAGAISLSCLLLTLTFFYIDIFSLPIYVLIILYTAIAYLIGVVLHEIGKILFDLIPSFYPEKINVEKAITDKKRPLCPFKAIQYEFNLSLYNICDGNIDFYSALNEIKNDSHSSMAKLDKYHSIYGLSRSLCLFFFAHAIGLSLFSAFGDSIPCVGWLLAGISLALAVLFYIRAYRYFYSWVKNIYIRYAKIKADSSQSSASPEKTYVI